MHLLNLTLGQFFVVFGSISAVTLALYLLDRSRRRQVVSTLRFWVAAERPAIATRRRRISQPLSLILQVISICLLLLAIAQLRFGDLAGAPRNHILILDTSAWMNARAGDRTLMDLAREKAYSYLRAVSAGDRVMLVRADALATPATAFEPDRKKLEMAVSASHPGATALNLEQALVFARQLQARNDGRSGEIAFVGTNRIAERDPRAAEAALRGVRVLPVNDPIENCGLRKIGLRRSSSDPGLWEIYVSSRNYGTAPRTLTLALSFGGMASGAAGSPVGTRRFTLAPGAEGEQTFEYRTRAAGYLSAELQPHDAFAEDDQASLELPPQNRLRVAVYSEQPDLLRPVLTANPRVDASFHKPAEYRPDPGAGLVILDRFRPPSQPRVDSIWIDPPSGSGPISIRSRATNVAFSRWRGETPLGAGLRTRDFKLDAVSVFEAAPTDIQIGEIESGPVIVARDGKPKAVVLGFHPALSPMRYETSTPLLFANILRWMAPETFRRWELSGASVGSIKLLLDRDVQPSDMRITRDDGSAVPFTVRDRALHLFAGTPGTIRVLAGDYEYVYSLTLPQLWESRYTIPADARRGIPRFNRGGATAIDLWQWLALLGGAGLIAEWILFGRLQRAAGRMRRGTVPLRARLGKAS